MGNNIKDLDALHQVMRGDITLDKACEGMTDDFEIGHVSHRADGDYRKVAPGKWVPVKAGGQQMKQGGGDTSAKPASGIEAWKKDEGVAGRDLYTSPDGQHKIRVNRNYLAGRRTFSLGTKENGKWEHKGEFDTIEEAVAAAKPAEQKSGGEKANPYKADQDNFMRLLQKVEGKEYTDPAKVKVYRTDKGNWNVYYDGHRLGIYDKSKLDSEAADELGWLERSMPDFDDEQGGGTESDGPNTAMQYERSQFKFRKHITHAIPMGKEEKTALDRISSYFEGGKRNASDAIDNYADHLIKENMENGNNNEAQERAVMRIAHAIGYGHELHDKIKRGRNGYDFGYDDEQGSFYEGDNDDLEEASNELKERREQMYNNERYGVNQLEDDAAAPRLTGDTKIRLSRIKREQTQDERRTYKIGEISEKTGLQKTANGWREVKKGASSAGGKAEVNPITGKPLRPDVVAYANQKKAEAEQKRNTEKTAGGFTLAQNDRIKNAATDVITKRRGEKLTPADLQREYKMSEPEANEASRRINEYFSGLEKDRQEFAKAGEKKAQNAKPQASPMAGEKKSAPEQKPDAFNEKVVVRQGSKTKKLDETVHDHLVKNGDAYSDYSQNDVEELVLKPSGYRLKEEWTTNRKDGSYLSVYTNGKNTLKIEFSKNDEFRGVL